MAASKAFRLAKKAQKDQNILATRPIAKNLPSTVKPGAWEATRNAYFNDRPYTHAQLLEAQMVKKGVL